MKGAPVTTSSTSPSTTTTTLSATDAATRAAVKSCDSTTLQALLAAGTTIPTTSRADNQRNDCVVLRQRNSKNRLYLGKTALTGKVVDSAKSSFLNGQWTVSINFTGSGSAKWDAVGSQYFHQQVAIELDGIVQSAPTIQTRRPGVQLLRRYRADHRQLRPGRGSDLAKVINYGALPVQLKKLTTTSVSPTLGQDQLDAGIVAGHHRPAARRALHARVLPAARRGRDRRASL